MESADELKSVERQKNLEHWLRTSAGLSAMTMHPMTGDASFRRYFRIVMGGHSWVAMDAPPAAENCRPYIAIANALRAMDLHTPDIIQADIERGFLLLTDFGDMTYLNALNARNADLLYGRALDELAVLQGCLYVPYHILPPFTPDFMWQEWVWHKEWFLGKLLDLSLSREEETQLNACYALVVASAAAQPQVFMHRDYHSANLMVTVTGDIAILDFQDAFIGPLTYDLVSLLRDCYIDWPQERVKTWALQYRQTLIDKEVLLPVDQQEFLRWFDWMGVQRHLKALFTFARKHVRDQQSQYLRHIPRTLGYLLNVSRAYPELSALHDYFADTVQPAFEERYLCVP